MAGSAPHNLAANEANSDIGPPKNESVFPLAFH